MLTTYAPSDDLAKRSLQAASSRSRQESPFRRPYDPCLIFQVLYLGRGRMDWNFAMHRSAGTVGSERLAKSLESAHAASNPSDIDSQSSLMLPQTY